MQDIRVVAKALASVPQNKDFVPLQTTVESSEPTKQQCIVSLIKPPQDYGLLSLSSVFTIVRLFARMPPHTPASIPRRLKKMSSQLKKKSTNDYEGKMPQSLGNKRDGMLLSSQIGDLLRLITDVADIVDTTSRAESIRWPLLDKTDSYSSNESITPPTPVVKPMDSCSSDSTDSLSPQEDIEPLDIGPPAFHLGTETECVKTCQVRCGRPEIVDGIAPLARTAHVLTYQGQGISRRKYRLDNIEMLMDEIDVDIMTYNLTDSL